MTNQSTFNSLSDLSSFKDQMNEKIIKAKSILTCIMFAIEYVRDDIKLNNYTLYNALWVADDYLEELEMLLNQLEKVH